MQGIKLFRAWDHSQLSSSLTKMAAFPNEWTTKTLASRLWTLSRQFATTILLIRVSSTSAIVLWRMVSFSRSNLESGARIRLEHALYFDFGPELKQCNFPHSPWHSTQLLGSSIGLSHTHTIRRLRSKWWEPLIVAPSLPAKWESLFSFLVGMLSTGTPPWAPHVVCVTCVGPT